MDTAIRIPDAVDYMNDIVDALSIIGATKPEINEALAYDGKADLHISGWILEVVRSFYDKIGTRFKEDRDKQDTIIQEKKRNFADNDELQNELTPYARIAYAEECVNKNEVLAKGDKEQICKLIMELKEERKTLSYD